MPENRRAAERPRGDSGANPGLLFHSSVFLRRFVVYCVLYALLRDAWPRRDDAAEARFRALFLERFMGETIDTAPEQRRAVLVAVVRERQDERQANEYLDELEFLAETAGIRSVKRFTQRLAAPSAKTFIGEGKLAEIAAFVEENEIRYVIFDDELSPSQLRNLDKVFKNKIYDRTSLILDIFVQRATTAYAKAQVELAQCQYLLPRLAGMWTHLERQRGGTGTDRKSVV